MRALPLLLAALLVLPGCFNVSWNGGERVDGSGTSASRTVGADGARSVRLAAPGVLVVERGAGPLVIEGDDNLIDRLEVEVSGGELRIATPDGESFRPETPLRYRVGIDRLEGIEVAGSGRVEASASGADRFRIRMAGSGAAEVTGVDATEASVEIAGSGDVAIAGRVGRLDVEVAGSGNVEAGDLEAGDANVSITGSGDVALRVEKTLDATIRGSGDVRYSGAPVVSRSVLGSGDVRPAGE